MPKCRLCENNGEPKEVYESHNRTDALKCPYNERYPKELRKKVVHHVDDDTDAELSAPELRISFPSPARSSRDRGLDPTPRPERRVDEVATIAANLTIAVAHIITEMHASKIAQQDALEIFQLRLLETEDDKVEKRLRKAIEIAKEWLPEAPATLEDTDETDNGKEFNLLQKRHGKLVGTLAACHKHVTHELHQSKASLVKEMLFDPDTNRPVLQVKAQDDISSWHLLYLVLVDFCYVATHFRYLTVDECRAFQRHAARRGHIGTDCVPTYRVLRRLLTEMDGQSSQDLGDLIKISAANMLQEELELCPPCNGGNNAGDEAGKGVRSGTKAKWNLKSGSNLAVPYPRSSVCWWWTNGAPCEDFDASGKCKWIAHHGKCGKRIKDPANPNAFSFCQDNHRAKDCPK